MPGKQCLGVVRNCDTKIGIHVSFENHEAPGEDIFHALGCGYEHPSGLLNIKIERSSAKDGYGRFTLGSSFWLKSGLLSLNTVELSLTF